MRWKQLGTVAALDVAARHVVRWRGAVIDCGERSQHKRMLELIADNDRLDLGAFMRDAGFGSVGTLRKAISTLNQHIKTHRFSVNEPNNLLLVKLVT